ncbi:MAG: efflux RND transporter permease subunit [Desulfobulbus sp.]|jgi:multidrug efflux pump subunit AcrB
MNAPQDHPGFAGRLARAFSDSKLTVIGLAASLLLGLLALVLLPREEEPQIKVPMIDVLVTMPGATAKEVEQRVAAPMEKLLYELSGIEYIYSVSQPGQCLLTARFFVGEDMEKSIVDLNQKLQTNFDRIPHGVGKPLIKPHTIDDVPILCLTFHSAEYDHFTLRRLAVEVEDAVKSIFEVAETKVTGGARRQLRIEFDPQRLAAHGLNPDDLARQFQAANRQTPAGTLKAMNKETLVQTGLFLDSAEEAGRIVVGVHSGKLVLLREVASVTDGPAETDSYVLHTDRGGRAEAAVTLSVAKRPGANAVRVVETVLHKVEQLKGGLIPAGVSVTVSRDYGETAAEKSNELLFHMGIAVFGVALLILFFLGWREAIVVLLAIPSTLALTLLLFYLYGYTLNRITLFALIFSIGILVDDAIVVVENIVRHLRLPANQQLSLREIAVNAVIEVGNPTILATMAVVAAILPMAFVGGMMGPYMRPIPVGSSTAMLFSLIIAFTVTPWAAIRILRKEPGPLQSASHDPDHAPDDWFTRLYHRVMDPLLAHTRWRIIFFLAITALLVAACALVPLGLVKVKMLPFDNKSEFQIILNMPEGGSLEQTARVAMDMAGVVAQEPEVVNTQVYAGVAAPYNFNGLVRHYFLRSGPSVADIQVNLLPKAERDRQSHEIAAAIRPAVAALAARYGATVAVAEVPPGPPVLQTLVAEVHGPDESSRVALATKIKTIFADTTGVVDLDWSRENERSKLVLEVDREKAALNGFPVATVTEAVCTALFGRSIDLFHQPPDREEIEVILQLPQDKRARIGDLLELALHPPGQSGQSGKGSVPLRELVRVVEQPVEQPIHRMNLKPVIYVTGDVAGAAESPVYPILQMNEHIARLDAAEFGGAPGPIAVHNLKQPFTDRQPSLKWDGEWHITLEVFRDLGIAFGVVMILIYMLMVGWFRDYIVPLVVMAAIPFSLIGILPAHWAMNSFFSATSMIGFMAGAGIVVRNSIILVDFIELRLRHGLPLASAVTEAGAIRFRPMLLTAMAVVVGAAVILADPIFQGLAIALMFGEIASLLISRMAVPVLYFMVQSRRRPLRPDDASLASREQARHDQITPGLRHG